MNGILLLDKPAGWTSMDCCAAIRRMTGEKKVGHTGTLDPDATGVLPVCLGKATRLIEYMEGAAKRYRCRCLLGIETETYDLSGARTGGVRPQDGVPYEWSPEDAVRDALAGFSGEILQMPPLYSSVRIKGRHLYDYARKNQSVEIAPRRVTILEIRLLSYDRAAGELLFDVCCSRGTYIRSICHDLGSILGTGAVMAALQRTACSGFSLEDCISMEQLRAEGAGAHLLPMATAVAHMPRLQLFGEAADLFGIGDERWAAQADPVLLGREGLQAAFCGEKLLGTVRDGRIEKVVDEYHTES